MTYDEACAELAKINARVYGMRAPKLSAPIEDHIAYSAERAEISADAKALGFIRIFDGSFKLNLKAFA